MSGENSDDEFLENDDSRADHKGMTNPNQSLLDVVGSLRTRFAWRVAATIFKSADLPVGQGWDRSLAKVEQVPESAKGILLEALSEHILCGDKNVRVYESGETKFDEEVEALRRSIDHSSLLKQAYPLCLHSDALSEVAPDQPEVVDVQETKDVVYVVFASNKEVAIRNKLDRDLVASAFRDGNDELVEAVRSSHEILAVYIDRRHSFDVAVLHKHTGRIEVRVDTFANAAPPLRVNEILGSHVRLIKTFTEIVGRPLFRNQLNFYPTIQKLLMIDEGKEDRKVTITRYGCVGPTGIARDERKPHGDVRSDPSHLAAFKAQDEGAGSISPYDIEVQFPGERLPEQPKIVLSLHGTETIARSTFPVLDQLTISKCVYEEEFGQVMGAVYERMD